MCASVQVFVGAIFIWFSLTNSFLQDLSLWGWTSKITSSFSFAFKMSSSHIKPSALALRNSTDDLHSLPFWNPKPHFWVSLSFNIQALCVLNILYSKTRFLTAVTFPAKSLLLTETMSKITLFLAGSVTVLLSSMSASTCRNNWALLLLIAFVLQCISMDRSYFHVVGQLFWLHSYLALWFC